MPAHSAELRQPPRGPSLGASNAEGASVSDGRVHRGARVGGARGVEAAEV
ncbi:MAG: hypothetical protein R3A52_00685 [Polyangiales bacterium]